MQMRIPKTMASFVNTGLIKFRIILLACVLQN